ncbi:hypothetical protein M436DRAFT_86495 [Aureobasidium namibiae CBS 147.97]|uniref:Gfo/Idh/MocA-like oxidoreductase N-terminal domain-containing protein n=1 Tax=Aureobasidium namibiae CBS 147.97 TaxID=1043004 RepID=A0A074WEQ5_9PEZI
MVLNLAYLFNAAILIPYICNTITSEAPKGLALIGLGNRGLGKALQYLEAETSFQLVAACDPNQAAITPFKDLNPDVPCFQDVNTMLENQNSRAGPPRVEYAYVAVPHSEYRSILPPLLCHQIHVLKEKPAGLNITELRCFQDLASANNVRLVTLTEEEKMSDSNSLGRCGYTYHLADGTDTLKSSADMHHDSQLAASQA